MKNSMFGETCKSLVEIERNCVPRRKDTTFVTSAKTLGHEKLIYKHKTLEEINVLLEQSSTVLQSGYEDN